jgi:hypothetical protein
MTEDQQRALITFVERIQGEMTATLLEVKVAVETSHEAMERGTRAVRRLQRNLEDIADLTRYLRDDGEPQ